MLLVLTADSIIEAIGDNPVVIIDTETSSLYPWRDGKILAGVGVKPRGGESFYLPFRHQNGGKQASLKELAKLGEALRGRELVFHNPKFDLAVLYNDGLDLSDEDVTDTVVLVRLVSEDEISYELKRLAKKYLDPVAGESQKALRTLIKKMGWYETDESGDIVLRYDKVPAEVIASPYVEDDLRFTEGLYDKAMPFISSRGLKELLELEKQLTKRLFHVERYGFQLDREYIEGELRSISQLVDELERENGKLARVALRARVKELKLTSVVKRWLKLPKKEREKELKQHSSETEKLLIGCEFARKESEEAEGEEFNTYSSHDVRKVFEALGVISDVKTKKGASSWAKTALAVVDHPLADNIVRCRATKNIKNYYETFIELMDSWAVIHCSLHQAGTRTGRLSCRSPNLQNVPRFEAFTGAKTGAIASMKRLKMKQEEAELKAKTKRYLEAGKHQISFDDEIAKEILGEFEGELFGKVRGAFVPRPGHFLLSVDWQQIELRIFADFAGEDELLKAFDLGLDVHRFTAIAAFGSLPDPKRNEQLYKWVRNMGKQIAFGLLYGMGIALLAIEIGRSKEEAQEFMDRYFARFRYAKQWIDSIHVECGDNGFVVDLWGRRRYLPRKLVYKAVNFLVQGSAADLMKDAFIRVYDALKNYGTKILLTIHDEIIFEVPYNEAALVIPIIIKEMETCERIKARLRCDAAWAPERWSQMYEDKYVKLCDLKCDVCGGKGQIPSLPGIEPEKVQDMLLVALYENNSKLLRSAEIHDCEACEARGYDLGKLLGYAEERGLLS